MAFKTLREIAFVQIYHGGDGWRYTCRSEDGKVIADSDRFFSSRRKALNEVRRNWPEAQVNAGGMR